MLREVDVYGTAEIDSAASVAPGSLAMVLHLVRQLLRVCLQKPLSQRMNPSPATQ